MNGGFFSLAIAAAYVASAPPTPTVQPQRQETRSQRGPVVTAICLPTAAKPSDVTPGKEVRDAYRILLGTVELVGPDSAIVSGEHGSLRFPLEAFGIWCDGSLILGISPGRFKKLATEHSK